MNQYQAESIDMDLADQDAEDKKFRIEELINQRNYWHQRAVKAEKKLTTAPDLLTALKASYAALKSIWDDQTAGPDLWPVMEQIRIAVSRAEGRLP